MTGSDTESADAPTTVGPYIVLRKLGAGGMGEVFLARDPRLEREVALKTLPPEFAGNPDRMARFRREALALAAINHPNIATVFGFEEIDGGGRVLVLERVEGETLADRLHRGALPWGEALLIAAQVAEALEAAHARGVIHRDLKPGNVMVTPRGIVKVLDFGLALTTGRADDGLDDAATVVGGVPAPAASDAPLDDDRTVAFDTPSDLASGTPGYMSPEQARGEPQDERTDLFSFGCVFYELLTGRRAFQGRSHADAIVKVLHSEPDTSTLPRALPARAAELLRRCLAKDVAQRPESMHAVRLELEEALGIRRASAIRAGETAAAPTHHLPRQPTRFVGRRDALETCRTLLAGTRLLTLTGVGGCGKTRLAVELAEQVASEHPGGVWFVDLAALSDRERVPQAVATVVGVAEESGVPITTSLTRYLADRRVILVLDNCEHVLDACAALADALLGGAAGLTLLATSREGLGVRWERTYAVPSLAVPTASATADAAATSEAVLLFADRATLVQPDFAVTPENAPMVGEICRRLDGIPLAIELAAARMRLLSLEQIQARLHDRFKLLAGGSKTALPRHQTLLAAIQWSYDQLGPDEQQLLQVLSVFVSGWSLEAAIACAGDRDEFEVLDLLTHLVDKSLVVVDRRDGGEPRYRYLETVRQFARDLLIAGGAAEAVRRRHRDWFQGLVARSEGQLTGPDQAEWLDRLEVEHDNIRAALDWTLEHEPTGDAATQIATGMAWFWLIRGHMTEGRERVEAVIAADPADPVTAGRATLHHTAGNFATRHAEYPAARIRYERARAMREQLGDRRGLAGTMGALGNIAQYTGDFELARALFTESLAVNREIGHRLWEATNLTCLGNLSRYLGDFAAARPYLEQAAALNREIGNRTGEASSMDGLGSLLMQMGELDAARTALERALELERESGNANDVGVTTISLGLVALRRGDLPAAREHIRGGLVALQPLGARHQICDGLESMAEIAHRDGDHERAARLWGATEALRESIGTVIAPSDREAIEGYRDASRQALGDAAFDRAWKDGRAMDADAAIALATAASPA